MRPIEEIHAALQRIHAKACNHAAPAYMSVPANPERDADLIVSDAIAELAALRQRCEAAEQVIRDANRIVGHDWFSCSRENRAKQAVFHAALDAYTKTYLADEARKAPRGKR